MSRNGPIGQPGTSRQRGDRGRRSFTMPPPATSAAGTGRRRMPSARPARAAAGLRPATRLQGSRTAPQPARRAGLREPLRLHVPQQLGQHPADAAACNRLCAAATSAHQLPFGYAQPAQHRPPQPAQTVPAAGPIRAATISATTCRHRASRAMRQPRPASSRRQHDPPPFGAPQGYGETDAEFDEAMAEEEERAAPRPPRPDDRRRAGRGDRPRRRHGLHLQDLLRRRARGPAPVIKVTRAGRPRSSPRSPTARVSRTPTRSFSTGSARRAARPAVARRRRDQRRRRTRASDDPNAPRRCGSFPITPAAVRSRRTTATAAAAARRRPPLVACPA